MRDLLGFTPDCRRSRRARTIMKWSRRRHSDSPSITSAVRTCSRHPRHVTAKATMAWPTTAARWG